MLAMVDGTCGDDRYGLCSLHAAWTIVSCCDKLKGVSALFLHIFVSNPILTHDLFPSCWVQSSHCLKNIL
jgi:hypothetical protein